MLNTTSRQIILKIIFLSTILTMCLTITFTQEVSKPLDRLLWHVRESNNSIGNFFSPSSFRKSINYLSEGDAVLAIHFEDGQGGAVRMDENGKLLWQTKVSGSVTGIGRIENNILVFYADEESKGGGLVSIVPEAEKMSTYVRVALLNGKTGKLIKDKLLYDNNKAVYIDSRSLNRPDNNFASLLIRLTNFKKASINVDKVIDERLETEKILAVTMDGDLNTVTTELKSEGNKGWFIGAEIGPNDDIYLSTFIKSQLIAERFNKKGELVNKLSAPLEIKSFAGLAEPVTSVPLDNKELFFVGLRYPKKNKDYKNQVFEFDFSAKKVSGSGEQELNKVYEKTFEVSKIKELKGGFLDYTESLKIMNIIPTKEKIAIIKTIQFQSTTTRVSSTGNGNIKDIDESSSTRYRSDAVVIDIYNRNWKLLKTIALDRQFESFSPYVGRSVGAHIVDEKLYIIVPTIKSIGKWTTLFAQINMSDLRVEKYIALPREFSQDGLKGPVVEGDACIWLNKGVLIPNFIQSEGLRLRNTRDKVNTIWQKVTF